MFYIILYFITIFSCYSWLVLLQLTVAIPIQFFMNEDTTIDNLFISDVWRQPDRSLRNQSFDGRQLFDRLCARDRHQNPIKRSSLLSRLGPKQKLFVDFAQVGNDWRTWAEKFCSLQCLQSAVDASRCTRCTQTGTTV